MSWGELESLWALTCRDAAIVLKTSVGKKSSATYPNSKLWNPSDKKWRQDGKAFSFVFVIIGLKGLSGL